MLFSEFLFYTEDNSGIFLFIGEFTICKGESKGKEFDFGFLNIFREMLTGTFGIDTDFRAEVIV